MTNMTAYSAIEQLRRIFQRRTKQFLQTLILVSLITITAACAIEELPETPPEVAPGPKDAACNIQSIERAPDGIRIWSPDFKQYVINKKDDAGIYQIYVGKKGDRNPVCISCRSRKNGPLVDRHKLQPRWHPSGEWISIAAERESYKKPLIATKKLVEGWLQSGLWVDIYLTKPDGSAWYQLSDFANHKADGFVGVAFTPNGKQGAWAQIVDGNIFENVFGRWELILADFRVNKRGRPRFTNLRNITPDDANWVEVGNFSPDGKSLMISSDIGMDDAQGMDQFILDITTGEVRNMTNSPKLWDEHGVFSPDGKKIMFMSSYPFRKDPNWHNTIFLKTEIMMMNSDGTGLQQLTHFNTPDFPESNKKSNPRSVAANGAWYPDGRRITVLNLFFPVYETWTINFDGRCGGRKLRKKRS